MLPTTRQLPYEPEKIRSDNREDLVSAQKKTVKENILMYEDIAKEHNALEARVDDLEDTLPSFLANMSAAGNNETGDGTEYTVPFGTEVFDATGDFASNTFTAPITGKYYLSATVYCDGVAAGHVNALLRIVTSNRTYRFDSPIDAFNQQKHLSIVADMDAGDTAYVTIVVAGGTKTVDIYGDTTSIYTFFCGAMIK